MKTIKIVYWTSTSLLSAGFLMSAVMYLTKNSELMKNFASIGYPAYVVTFLGLAKLLGAFKKLFEVMKKTTLTPNQQSMLLEGLEENGDLEEEEREQMTKAVRQGKFPLSLGNGPRLPSFG